MIIIFEQDLTHYRALFYEYLVKTLRYDILIVYGKGEPGSSHILKDGGKSFKTLEIERYWLGSSLYIQSFDKVKKLVRECSVSCVIHRGAIRNIGLYKEISYFQKSGIPVILRGIGFSSRRAFNPKKNIADYYHQKIIEKADAYLCYTPGGKKVLDQFHDPSKVFIAVNTLNSNVLDEHYQYLITRGKLEVKSELGLERSRYLIHVGRLSARKKIKTLIDVYGLLKSESSDIGLILVGDGPERATIESYSRSLGLSDIIFAGAISSENILASKYLFSADVSVITGNIGLSINHSLFFGVPVVGFIATSEECKPKDYVLAPEHEYLVDHYNGRVVYNYLIDEFAARTRDVLSDSELGKNAYKYAHEFLTVEQMAKGYKNAINYVINSSQHAKGL